MARACDRCKKSINPKETMTIKFSVNFREFIINIRTVLARANNGIEDPAHIQKHGTGKFELCGDCRDGLMAYITKI